MFRRSLISLLIAVALMTMLAAAVGAQSADDADAEVAVPSIEPVGGGIVQAIPFTLTINIPGPNGMQTFEVPIVLSLDIQIGLGNVLTTSVVVTQEVVTPEEEPVEETPAEATPEPTEAAPTEVPPTPVPPTATPAEPTAAPTEAAPTPRPVGQTPTAEPETEATAVPEEEATPEAEEEPTPEPVAVIDPESCSDPRSVITAPASGEAVSGTIEVIGTADHVLFNYYKLEYTQVGDESSGEYAFIMDSKLKVIDGLLAKLDTTDLDNGEYVLRLTVVDNTGNFPPQCSVPVEIAN